MRQCTFIQLLTDSDILVHVLQKFNKSPGFLKIFKSADDTECTVLMIRPCVFCVFRNNPLNFLEKTLFITFTL